MIELDVGASVLWSLAGLYAILLIASLVVALLSWRDPEKDRGELVKRIRSWWIIVTVFTLAMVLSRNVAVGFFAFVSFLALKEFLSIIPTRCASFRVVPNSTPTPRSRPSSTT